MVQHRRISFASRDVFSFGYLFCINHNLGTYNGCLVDSLNKVFLSAFQRSSIDRWVPITTKKSYLKPRSQSIKNIKFPNFTFPSSCVSSAFLPFSSSPCFHSPLHPRAPIIALPLTKFTNQHAPSFPKKLTKSAMECVQQRCKDVINNAQPSMVLPVEKGYLLIQQGSPVSRLATPLQINFSSHIATFIH